ncbi:MAG TPA: histidine kinase [Ilumatobacteraceae bacterium]|nr:histidine kinase [Ilumatobacteraceae bacterium]
MTTAYGTLAYGVAIGVQAMTSVLFVSIGLRRSRGSGRPFMFSFALLTGLGALAAWNVVSMHTSSSVGEYRGAFEAFGVIGLLTVVSVILVVATWTGNIPRWALVAFGIATAVVGTLQLVVSDGLLADVIVEVRSVELFGETFVVHEASRSAWRPVLDAYLLASLLMVVVSLAVHFRRGRRSESAVMSVGLIVLLGFAAYDSLVDEGVVGTPYLAPFGGVVIAVVGAVLVSGRLSRAERQVAEHSVRLEQTVVERTAALIAANDELNEQLARQRLTMRRLELLTAGFERSNQLAGPGAGTDDARGVVTSLLGTLGTVLGLRRADLRLNGVDPSDVLPAVSEWVSGPSEPVGGEDDVVIEVVAMEGLTLGTLEVVPGPSLSFGDEERRYVRLAAEHLAGFVHRTELDSMIAANAVDVERHRIARDLHDSVTQRLYSAAFLADAAQRQLSSGSGDAEDTVRRIRSLLLTSLSELRVLLFELQPQSLDATSFPQLIEQLVETVAAAVDGDVQADVDEIPSLPRAVKLGLYRLAQESLSNAVRHSGARSIAVRVGHDQGTTFLVVSDTGTGFDTECTTQGHGLRNLEERAASIGAELLIDSRSDVGTTVTVNWSARGGQP